MLPTLVLAKLIKTTWWTTKSYVISKTICRHLMKWLVFCPHPFFQICLLLKITTWMWISRQCQSRSCRLWANLQNLSRTWLTAACWSYTWKSGMTQPSTRLWFNCTVGHKSLTDVWRVSLSFLVRIIDVFFFLHWKWFLVLKFLSTCCIVNMVVWSLHGLWHQNDLDWNVYTSWLGHLKSVN